MARLSLWLLASILLFAQNSTTAEAQRDRIKYDHQCLTIDGQDVVVFSGAFHYFRCPKELWRDRFGKLRDAGLNAVETYVPWNHHEPLPPKDPDDFSRIDMRDLDEWLRMAIDEFDFYVILRPGPYICAEWEGGGYPGWLLTHRPRSFPEKAAWLRGDEETYLSWCRHWFKAVADVAAPYQLTRRPAGRKGIILWQVENEYDYAQQPKDVCVNQIKALATYSRELGIEVPLITCVTRRAGYRDDPFLRDNIVETHNAYPIWDMAGMRRGLAQLEAYQPDKFKMISELQGGWFGSVDSRDDYARQLDGGQITHVTLLALERGCTALNYYMFFGGTNFGDHASSGITTSYDYNAPIREPGGVGERWRAVAAIGNMLKEHGPRLARSVEIGTDFMQRSHQDISVTVRVAPDGSRFIFVRTEQRDGPRRGTVELRLKGHDAIKFEYDLPSFGARVLCLPPNESKGVWLPDETTVAMPARPAPRDLPTPIKIESAQRRLDPGPAAWRAMEAGRTLEDMGVFDSRFVFYRATLPPEAHSTGTDAAITVSIPKGDGAAAWVDGEPLPPIASRASIAAFRLPAPAGSSSASGGGRELLILYENRGRPHHISLGMDRPKGVGSVQLLPLESLGQPLARWKMRAVETPEQPPEVAAGFDDSDWPAVAVGSREGRVRENGAAVFRTTFDVPQDVEQSPQRLTFECIDDDGWIYVNGTKVGEAHDYSRAHTFDLAGHVKPGRNVVAVVVRNGSGPGGLTREVRVEPVDARARAIPLAQIATDSVQPDDTQWGNVSLADHQPAAASVPLSWYRVTFALPKASSGIWAPWKIRLDARGNGFLYLNGRPLGRYWQDGPQREYYLPECWLRFDEGETNELTMCLRRVDEPVALKSAEISVYEDQAELRR